jgi:hypothetical protein
MLSVQNSLHPFAIASSNPLSKKSSEQEARLALTPALNYLGTRAKNIDEP